MFNFIMELWRYIVGWFNLISLGYPFDDTRFQENCWKRCWVQYLTLDFDLSVWWVNSKLQSVGDIISYKHITHIFSWPQKSQHVGHSAKKYECWLVWKLKKKIHPLYFVLAVLVGMISRVFEKRWDQKLIFRSEFYKFF